MGKVKQTILTETTQAARDSIKRRCDDLKELVDDLERDVDKFCDKGNKAAGTRIRVQLQELKRQAQEIRIMVQGTKKAKEDVTE